MLLLMLIGFVALVYLWLSTRRRFRRLHGVARVGTLRAAARVRCARWMSAQCVQFALRLPLDSLKGSFLIIGAPRTGKTVLINLFRQSLLFLFEDSEEDILVIDFDPKRENQFWSRFLPPRVPYLDLSPSIQGVGLDLLGECETDADIVTIADAFVPEGKGDPQPYFRNSAVLLLASVLRAARRLGHKLTLRQIVLICTDLGHLRKYLKSCPLTASVAEGYLADKEGAKGVFTTLATAMQSYRTVAAAWDHADRLVTVSEFLAFPKAVLNLPYEDDAVPVLTPIIRLLLLRLEQKVLKQNKKRRRVIFLLDEFRILREVRLILLACKGAEAGVSLFYACQSVVGAKEAHGEPIVTELFSLTKNRIFLRVDGFEDATYVKNSLGKRHGYRRFYSKQGWSESQCSLDNAPEEVVMNLPYPRDGHLVIHGFATTPYTGPFVLRFPFRHHLPFLNAAKDSPRLPPRPPAHFDLEPLMRPERRGLGL